MTSAMMPEGYLCLFEIVLIIFPPKFEFGGKDDQPKFLISAYLCRKLGLTFPGITERALHNFMNIAICPALSGLKHPYTITQGVALGWYLTPLQG